MALALATAPMHAPSVAVTTAHGFLRSDGSTTMACDTCHLPETPVDDLWEALGDHDRNNHLALCTWSRERSAWILPAESQMTPLEASEAFNGQPFADAPDLPVLAMPALSGFTI